jgi:hypothetical protein
MRERKNTGPHREEHHHGNAVHAALPKNDRGPDDAVILPDGEWRMGIAKVGVPYHDDGQAAPALDFSCLDRFFFEA